MKKYKLILLVLIIILGISFVYADGGFFPSYSSLLKIPKQKAVITWNGSEETMILASYVQSDNLENIAWIIPIKSEYPPIVNASNNTIFKELDSMFRDYWYKSVRTNDTPTGAGGSGVSLIEQKEIDVFDISILEADDASDLLDWLNENSYKIPERTELVIENYIFYGTRYFVAIKLDFTNKYKEEMEKIEELEKEYFNYFLFKKNLYETVSYIDYIISIDDFAEDNINENAIKFYQYVGDFFENNELDEAGFLRDRFYNYYYLYSNFIEDFVSEYPDYFLNDGSNNIQAKKWSSIARSFHEPRYERFEPGIYCKNNEDDWRGTRLVYKSELTKGYSSIGVCDEEHNIKINDSIEDFHKMHMNLYDEIEQRVKNFNNVIRNKNLNKEKIKELESLIYNLANGRATPLQIKFNPEEPTYPLLISSLNEGVSKIGVYVFTNNEVIDKNHILEIWDTKDLDEDTRRKLKKYINIGDAKKVTLLYYDGSLKDLSDDAIFLNAKINLTRVIDKDCPEIYICGDGSEIKYCEYDRYGCSCIDNPDLKCVELGKIKCPEIPIQCPGGAELIQEKDSRGCIRLAKCIWRLSNGRNAEIKIMPETASERAIERLGELNFSVVFREVGKDSEMRPVYEATGNKQGRFLGIFKIMATVSAQVDAETGEIIKTKKPWWSFLVSGI